MKIKFINFLVSILYVPLLFIGQFIGNIFGTLLSLIILNFDLLWFSYFANLLSEILFMLIGGIIGWTVDKWLDTNPWFLILFFLLGGAAGILNLWRVVSGKGLKIGYF